MHEPATVSMRCVRILTLQSEGILAGPPLIIPPPSVHALGDAQEDRGD